MTSLDALGMTSITTVSVARASVRRLRNRLRGQTADDDRRQAYRANAAFVESLGLDPSAVLIAPRVTQSAGDDPRPAHHDDAAFVESLRLDQHAVLVGSGVSEARH